MAGTFFICREGIPNHTPHTIVSSPYGYGTGGVLRKRGDAFITLTSAELLPLGSAEVVLLDLILNSTESLKSDLEDGRYSRKGKLQAWKPHDGAAPPLRNHKLPAV
jgi:hypothetical protein